MCFSVSSNKPESSRRIDEVESSVQGFYLGLLILSIARGFWLHNIKECTAGSWPQQKGAYHISLSPRDVGLLYASMSRRAVVVGLIVPFLRVVIEGVVLFGHHRVNRLPSSGFGLSKDIVVRAASVGVGV